MSMIRPLLLSLLLLAPLAGCNMVPQRESALVYHVLEDTGQASGAGSPVGRPSRHATLLVRETDTSRFYQSSALVYSQAPDSRAYYQYARWTTPLAPRLALLLRQRLANAALFLAVADLGAGVRGDYQLNTRLLDAFHDAATPPGRVRLVLEAEVVQRTTGQLLGRQQFSVEADATSHNARGAAQGFNQATVRLLDQVTDWVERTIPREAR